MDLSIPSNAYKTDGTVNWEALHRDPRFTESRQELIDLYTIAQLGQINDAEIRTLPADQLIFLAAHDPAVASFQIEMDRQREAIKDAHPHTPDHPIEVTKLHDLATKQNKLEANPRRARLELQRRSERSKRRWNVTALLVAGAIGALGGVIAAVVAAS